MKSGKISLADTKTFAVGDVSGKTYVDETVFDALEVTVDGMHGDKVLKVQMRMYRIEEGAGTFTLDGVSYDATPGDLFVIYKGTHWMYRGKMKLFEVTLK